MTSSTPPDEPTARPSADTPLEGNPPPENSDALAEQVAGTTANKETPNAAEGAPGGRADHVNGPTAAREPAETEHGEPSAPETADEPAQADQSDESLTDAVLEEEPTTSPEQHADVAKDADGMGTPDTDLSQDVADAGDVEALEQTDEGEDTAPLEDSTKTSVDEDTAPMEAVSDEDTLEQAEVASSPAEPFDHHAAAAPTPSGENSGDVNQEPATLETPPEDPYDPPLFAPRSGHDVGTTSHAAEIAGEASAPAEPDHSYDPYRPADGTHVDGAADSDVAGEGAATSKWHHEARETDTAELAAQEGGYPVQYVEEPPPSKSISKKIVIGVLGAVVVAGLGVAGFFLAANNSAPKVGQCIILQGNANNLKTAPADCSDTSKVVYKVAKTGSGKTLCPGDSYTKFTIPDRKDANKAEQYSCLVPLLNPDQCYGGDALTPYDCNDASAKLKVTKRLNSLDPQACQGLGSTVAYPEPAPGLTYCVAPPK